MSARRREENRRRWQERKEQQLAGRALCEATSLERRMRRLGLADVYELEALEARIRSAWVNIYGPEANVYKEKPNAVYKGGKKRGLAETQEREASEYWKRVYERRAEASASDRNARLGANHE